MKLLLVRVVGIGRLRLGYGFSTDTLVYMELPAFRQRAELGAPQG